MLDAISVALLCTKLCNLGRNIYEEICLFYGKYMQCNECNDYKPKKYLNNSVKQFMIK